MCSCFWPLKSRGGGKEEGVRECVCVPLCAALVSAFTTFWHGLASSQRAAATAAAVTQLSNLKPIAKRLKRLSRECDRVMCRFFTGRSRAALL